MPIPRLQNTFFPAKKRTDTTDTATYAANIAAVKTVWSQRKKRVAIVKNALKRRLLKRRLLKMALKMLPKMMLERWMLSGSNGYQNNGR